LENHGKYGGKLMENLGNGGSIFETPEIVRAVRVGVFLIKKENGRRIFITHSDNNSCMRLQYPIQWE
jgi:hypothetical protein